MARKGLIFSIHSDDKPASYQAVPFIVGIYEFQINRLTEGLLQDLAEYWSTQKQRPQAQTIPKMRTIPVGQSIDPHLEALPYEQVDELTKAHNRFAVAPCICRRHAKMRGEGCEAPEESCLIFWRFCGLLCLGWSRPFYGEKPENAQPLRGWLPHCGGGEWQSGGLRQFTALP